MKKILSLIVIGVFTTLTTLSTVQADAIDDTIKARQSYFRLIAFNFGQLVAMAKGEAEYNAEAAQNAANNLKTITKLHSAPLYPAGSDNVAKKGKTRALPKLWEDFGGALKIVDEYKKAVTTLASVAGNGKAALGPAVGGVGKQCGACHETYRAKSF